MTVIELPYTSLPIDETPLRPEFSGRGPGYGGRALRDKCERRTPSLNWAAEPPIRL